MPFPLILIAIGPFILAALGGGIGGLIVGLVIEVLIEKLTGKEVAIIGARRSGKTTLASYLSSGLIPENYEQTLGKNILPGRTLVLSDLKLKIYEINDVGGDKDYYKDWKEVVTKCEIVYYLANADEIMAKMETRKRVLADVKHLSGWLLENPGKKVFFIGTHCDLISAYTKLTPDNIGDFKDAFFKNEEMKEVALRLRAVDAGLILGSLATERAIQQVLHQSFQIIQKNKK